ncbi:SPFH domain-containing protein [Cylindrospermum sp. FACHB-282]|uniref:SPFH domain-containing protein n=1 Tax=Cylindrospermum sp. FACHB-282 TaxID=2692794 RepID=UPI001689160A|nr:SPFH domain-containing protein [Cylindrospermum sp. FACHB-282]MBD2383997.1 SPFH/Band 7/PHB domain protein [Cylindrospermum sp. FACHB-282]
MEQFFLLVFLAFGGSAVAGSVRVINQGNEALVERLGSYNKKMQPGLNFVIPFFDKVVYRETIREKVLDIPPQKCITRDNVGIEVDAVVYWRIVDMEKAWYKVENLQSAMVNLVLTQIRSEMGQLELDQTFTARSQINELLLQDLDVSTDPWGVKVTRVELRDIIPSQAVREAMEMQMSAERRKRASILTSEGDRESAVNSARGKADAQLLDAEARQKSVILQAEAEQKAIVLKAQAERQQQVLRAQAIAESAEIIAQKIKTNPDTHKAIEVLFALGYLDMGATIGKSDSSKVIFIDPRTIPAALEGIRSVVSDYQADSHSLFNGEIPGQNNRAS